MLKVNDVVKVVRSSKENLAQYFTKEDIILFNKAIGEVGFIPIYYLDLELSKEWIEAKEKYNDAFNKFLEENKLYKL